MDELLDCIANLLEAVDIWEKAIQKQPQNFNDE